MPDEPNKAADEPTAKSTTAEDTTVVSDVAESGPPTSPKLGVGIAIMLVLATLATLLAFIALWANRQILSTDQWTKTSTELLEEPAVRDALAEYLVTELFDNVDVQGELETNLPDSLQGLAGPATGGLRQLALRGANAALETPAFQTAWRNANELAHKQLISALEGGNERISTEGGVVKIDTRLLLSDLAKQIGLPTSLIDKLPAAVGEFTVLQSDELEKAQKAESALRGMTWVFGLLALGLYVLSIWLAAGRRRRAVFFSGLSFMSVGLLILLIHSFAKAPLVDGLASTSSLVPAVGDVYDVSTELLSQMAFSFFISGLLVMAASWLAGPYRYAVGFRRAVAPYLRDYLPLSIAFVAILFLLVVWWAPTQGFRTTAGLSLNLLLAIAGFAALTVMTRREFPDAEATDLSVVGDWFGRHWSNARDWTSERARSIDVPKIGSSEPDRIDELERLQKLHESGALTDEEFSSAKRKLLDD